MGWQPIETARREADVRILLGNPEWPGPVIGYWSDFFTVPQWFHEDEHFGMGWGACEPTHWMPLPSLPTPDRSPTTPTDPQEAVVEAVAIPIAMGDTLTQTRQWNDDDYTADKDRQGYTWQACAGLAAHDSALRARLAEVEAEHLAWAVERWRAEVEKRPLVNRNRRPLDDAWRQMIRHFGGDDEALLGPRHDDLLTEPAK